MKRTLFGVVAFVTLLAVACGGDKNTSSSATSAPATQTTGSSATAKPASKTPAPAKTSGADGAKSKDVVSGLFSTLFTGALNGGTTPGSLGDGDPTLKQYLPADSDLPKGYAFQGQFTSRAPDGVSTSGGIDIAAEIATNGDPSAKDPDFSKLGLLMAIVLKPDDLQSLGSALDSIKELSEQDLASAFSQGGAGDTGGLIRVKNVKVLDASGVGDGGAGFQMTIDLGGLADILGALGGDATPASGGPDLSKLAITMRMYLFARGDYAGGVIRMAFADSLPGDVDELGLAKIIDGKLKAAR